MEGPLKCEPSGILSIGVYEMAWGRKTGGRKRGTPNKKTSVLAANAEAAAVGAPREMPLEYIVLIMPDPTTEPHRRDAGCGRTRPSTLFRGMKSRPSRTPLLLHAMGSAFTAATSKGPADALRCARIEVLSHGKGTFYAVK